MGNGVNGNHGLNVHCLVSKIQMNWIQCVNGIVLVIHQHRLWVENIVPAMINKRNCVVYPFVQSMENGRNGQCGVDVQRHVAMVQKFDIANVIIHRLNLVVPIVREKM